MKKAPWGIGLLVSGVAIGQAATSVVSTSPALSEAVFSASGQLQRPANLDEWIFLGASLGMNYSDAAFTVDHPGAFQVVLMEPKAYEYFKAHGIYADGSMFLLSFYETKRGESIDRAGFVPGALAAFEIHLIDKRRPGEGRVFYQFGKNDSQAAATPPGSTCVQCHVPKGAYDGTFTQFYPPLRDQVPKPAGSLR